MSDIVDSKIQELEEAFKNDLGEIEMKVETEGYTLADAIREGSTVTTQEIGGWGDGETACALTSGWLAAKARKVI